MQIIDAGMVAFAAWHALKGRIDWALTFQVPRMLKTLVEEAADTYVLCWNAERLEKREIWPAYRDRPEIWDLAGKDDFEAMLRVLTSLGVVQYRSDGREADELIAALVHRLKRKEPIVIRSDDKDFFQLLGPRTSMLGRVRGRIRAEDVSEIFGVPPELAADFQALTGDTADGIPRILTPASARRLLLTRGPLRAWIDAPDLEPALARTIAARREQILLNLKLVDLSPKAVGRPPKPLLEGFGDLAIARRIGKKANIKHLVTADLEDKMAPLLEWGKETRKRLAV